MARSTAAKSEIRQSFWLSFVAFVDLVYALVVRDLRSEHKNAALGILIQISVPLLFGLLFYLFITYVGGRPSMVRGDLMTFIILGFVLFFMHIRTVTAVAMALRGDMLNHQRLSPFLLICVKAVASAYKIILALLIMLALNYLLRDVYEMQDLYRFIVIFIWAWLGGIAIGIVFLALNRYVTWAQMIQTTYLRICFFTSGKFMVANNLPEKMRMWMDWNPLFHLLDQSRGAAFVNYTPRTTSLDYAIVVFCVLFVVAMLLENFVRRNYSQSYMAGD